jgi:hypothetical protein
MEGFRFTLFNSLTLFVMVLTLAMALFRRRARPETAWPLAYYVVIAAFAIAFRYSLSLWCVGAGVVFALLVRFVPEARRAARVAEFGALAYVFARSVALLLMW